MVPGIQVGAYRLVQQIGEGGMGTVWLAEHTMLGRRAAIKLLHAMYSARQDIVTRFFNEARAATAIADPGIVQIFDFGQHIDGTAYIAMEMLDGEPLDKRLRRLGRVPLGDAMRIMRQVASTLGVAHARGIIHRDLKPENIFLVRDPEVAGGERAKVLDFGIAKLTGDVAMGSQTQTSAVMGTPAYMSPEQCRGAGRVDHRSDVYSLGCMLFTLITGKLVFTADGSGELLAMQMFANPEPPSRHVTGVPPEVDALVLRCLAKDPAARFASGTELAAALGVLLGTASYPGAPVSTAPSMVPVAQPALTTAGTTLSSTSGQLAAQPRGRMIAISAAAVVVSGVIGTVAATRGDGKPEAKPSAPVAASLPAAAPPPAPAPAPAPAPPPVPPPAPDPNAQLASNMKQLLTQFVAWSHDHAQAPCPSAGELGAPVLDPWGRALIITCSDQPANEIAGALSLGPDGVAGTADDIGSWQLGREVTDLVHGARWAIAAPKPPVPPPGKHPHPNPPPHHAQTSDDDIPTER
jgi:serine/threonine-protein kinase